MNDNVACTQTGSESGGSQCLALSSTSVSASPQTLPPVSPLALVSFWFATRKSFVARWDYHTICLLLGLKARPRNGKVARLAETTRNQINRMLEDGLPYRTILKTLATSANPPLPYPLSEMNLSNWYRGGFQDWLRLRQGIRAIRTKSDPLKVTPRSPVQPPIANPPSHLHQITPGYTV